MKKILYIVFFLVTLCPLLSDGSMVLAQRMASEGTGLWSLADETGQYYMERCGFCNIAIYGNSDEQLHYNMCEHYNICPELNRSNEDDESDDYNNNEDNEYNTDFGDNGNNSNTGNWTYNGKCSVVDINVAANALVSLGIGTKRQIIADYNAYYGNYVENDLIPLNSFLSFIERIYGASYNKSSRCIVLIKWSYIYVECNEYLYYKVMARSLSNCDYIYYF